MSELKRSFTGKDVEMLTSTETILEHAIEHKTELQAKRSTWRGTFFEDLLAQNRQLTELNFGKDASKDLRGTTALIRGIQKTTLGELSFFKVQIEEDFKKDKAFVAETLKTLGFDDYYAGAKNRSQEALVQLLYSIKQNLTPALNDKLVQGGIEASLIEGLVNQAEALKKANVSQEVFKSNKRNISQETILQFNEIYDSVISVCKIASKIFGGNAAVKDKFNYSKTLRALTGTASASTKAKKAKAAKEAQLV